jgi:hypothetical protein
MVRVRVNNAKVKVVDLHFLLVMVSKDNNVPQVEECNNDLPGKVVLPQQVHSKHDQVPEDAVVLRLFHKPKPEIALQLLIPK